MATESKELAIASLNEADIDARLTALQAVEDDRSQWAEIAPDFGETVTFENVGDSFSGILAGKRVVPQPELDDAGKPTGRTRDANVYEMLGMDRERYSIWGSYAIDLKLGDLPVGTALRIEYRGERDFTDKVTKQPRRVKSFKVLMPVSGQVR